MKKTIRKVIAIALMMVMVLGSISVFADTFEGTTPFKLTSGGSTFNHNTKFQDDLILNGIDISYYQNANNTSWTTEEMGNVDFSIIRATWSGYRKDYHAYANEDSQFLTHYKKAKAAGKLVGVYVFSQAKNVNEARNEAAFAIARLQKCGIKPGDLNLPIYMDYEFAGGSDGRLTGISKTQATACVIAFCERIRDYGYTPGLYANLSFLNNTVYGSSLANYYDIWCAQYNTSCGFGGKYSKWQYSSKAKISGIKYNSASTTDVNFWYIDKTVNNSETIKAYLNEGAAVDNPTFDIYYGDKLLVQGRDYSLGYVKHTDEKYAYIQGIGAYAGEMLIPFPEEEPEEEQSEEALVEAVQPEDNLGVEEEPTELEEPTEPEELVEPESLTIIGKGLCMASARNPMSMGFSTSSYYYDGGSKKPSVTVVQNGAVVAKNVTASSNGITVLYPGAKTKPGTYYAQAYNLSKPGAAMVGYSIKIKPTSIKKLTRYKKAFKVKVAKQAKKYVTGYQVRYSLKPDMSKSKTKTISSKYKTVSKKVTKLKKKKTYYVQVRSYKKISGKKYYSAWSATKKVKTK